MQSEGEGDVSKLQLAFQFPTRAHERVRAASSSNAALILRLKDPGFALIPTNPIHLSESSWSTDSATDQARS